MVVHLNAHSYYSLLTGIPSPSELAAAAAAAGEAALALTDHNRLSGALEFTLACQSQGVKPILGMNVRVVLPRALSGSTANIALLSMDSDGWASLCHLSSRLLSDPGGDAKKLPYEVLKKHSEGLISFVTFDLNLGPALDNLKGLFSDRLYLGAGPNGSLQAAANFAKSVQLKLAIKWPIYYLKAEDADLQRTVTSMRVNQPLERLPQNTVAPNHSYFPTEEEITKRFSSSGVLEVAEEIAARCNFEWPLGAPIFPELDLPGNLKPLEVLRAKAFEGARRHYGDITEKIRQRLEHELDVIAASGYESLFLIMEEVVSFAHKSDVPISSRGSAASSLVAHCLDITTPDPLRLNLYFERFLNPARPTPPDVDTDICSRRRDIVIEHVYKRYGSDRVAMVATINRFRRRSALREVAKAHGLPPARIKEMVDTLPYRFWEPPGSTRPKYEKPYGELEERYREPRFQLIFQQAEALLDSPHHLSIHPGGIVISPSPLNDFVATQFSGKGVTITQYDLEGVQKIGLVKMDLLGIRGLTVLGDVADAIRKLNPEMGQTRLEVLGNIPDRDEKAAEIVRTGRTIGCFQIESPGMRATLREVQADRIDNVMLALALFRPGPLTGGLKDAFVRRHLGEEPVTHLHPTLAPMLEETHGVFLYQEQVLRVVHELAGFSISESDLLRRAMSHFDPGKRMQTLKEKFVARAGEMRGIDKELAEQIWDMMAAFSGYGFPKAHSASYAETAWRSAWCKAHYPAEFMAAVLANWGGYYNQKTYLTEARRLGLTIYSPHINHSLEQFSVSYIDRNPQLFMGLDQVRDLTSETQSKIIKQRPFNSLAEFLTRTFPRKGEARNLIEVGALEGLGTIPNLLEELDRGTWKQGQMPLFRGRNDPARDWSQAEKGAAQKRLLGVDLIGDLDWDAEEVSAVENALDYEYYSGSDGMPNGNAH